MHFSRQEALTVLLACLPVNCVFVLIRAMTCNEFQDLGCQIKCLVPIFVSFILTFSSFQMNLI